MDRDTEYLKEKMAQYGRDIAPLIKYLPWLESATEKATVSMYKGEGMDNETSLSFPVYDSTLMSFVKTAQVSPLMDRNYPYVYTRRRITCPEDERRLIEVCTYKEWDLLCGILSNYILGGRTKGVLWSQGVSEQIYYLILTKMNQIVTEWDAERNMN